MIQQTPFIKFDKPKIFSCSVNGKPLTATVTGKYDFPIQYGFQVSFNDGFSACFVSTDSGWWAERKGGKPYVDAISKQLDSLLTGP